MKSYFKKLNMNKLIVFLVLLFSFQIISNAQKTENLTDKIKEYEKLYKSDKSNSELIIQLITAYTYNQQYKEAVKLADKGVSLFPEDPEMLFSRGRALNLRKEFEKAITDFNRCIELNRKNLAEVYFQRGISYQNINMLDNSNQDFKKAIELNPNNEEYYSFYGITLYQLNEFKKAIEVFDIALSFGNENPILYLNKGLSHFKIDDKYNACKALQKACKLKNKAACELYVNDCLRIK